MTQTVQHHKEPLLRIVKRDGIARPKAYAIRIAAVLASLVVSGIFIFAITKLNPIQVYEAIFDGAFGTNRRSWLTIRDAMMLLCIGVGLAPAFKMKFWNIGAEGQILIGGVVTAGIMRAWGGDLPTPALLAVMGIVSLLCGCLWGVIPAVFKAVWNTNETLFTLMMNYVAIQITSYCVALWENPVGSNSVGIINQMTAYGHFPKVFGQAYGLNVVLVLILAVGMYIYLKYSKQGYEISVVGDSENTARYAGINVKKVTIRTMAISGAICGLAGVIYAGRTNSGLPAGGVNFEFEAIIGCVLGGTSMAGGIGNVVCSIIGVFVVGIINNVMNLCSVNAFWQQVVKGIVILVAVLLDVFTRNAIMKSTKKR